MKRFVLVLTPVLLTLVGLACAAPPAEDRYDDPDVQDLVFFGDSRPVLIRLRIQNGGRPFRQVWDDVVSGIFKKLDANKDGVLTGAELVKVPPPSLMFTGAVG